MVEQVSVEKRRAEVENLGRIARDAAEAAHAQASALLEERNILERARYAVQEVGYHASKERAEARRAVHTAQHLEQLLKDKVRQISFRYFWYV